MSQCGFKLCLFNYSSPAGRCWRASDKLTLTDTAWRHWERSLSLFVSSALCLGLYPFYKQQGFLYLCNTHLIIYINSPCLRLWEVNDLFLVGWASIFIILCATLVCYSVNAVCGSTSFCNLHLCRHIFCWLNASRVICLFFYSLEAGLDSWGWCRTWRSMCPSWPTRSKSSY